MLFLLIIYNNVQLNEKNSKVDELKFTVVELDSKLSELTLKVEKKNDLREIEQRALELGMVKADELKKVYVSINSADKVELVDDNADEKQSFRMTGLFEQVRSFFTGLFGLDDGSAETADRIKHVCVHTLSRTGIQIHRRKNQSTPEGRCRSGNKRKKNKRIYIKAGDNTAVRVYNSRARTYGKTVLSSGAPL